MEKISQSSFRNNLTLNDAINQIIYSIAMEGLSLSHIINAEGEKLQYVLSEFPEITNPQNSIHQILAYNKGVQNLLQTVLYSQMLLNFELMIALNANLSPTDETDFISENDYTCETGENNLITQSDPASTTEHILLSEESDINDMPCEILSNSDTTKKKDSIFKLLLQGNLFRRKNLKK